MRFPQVKCTWTNSIYCRAEICSRRGNAFINGSRLALVSSFYKFGEKTWFDIYFVKRKLKPHLRHGKFYHLANFSIFFFSFICHFIIWFFRHLQRRDSAHRYNNKTQICCRHPFCYKFLHNHKPHKMIFNLRVRESHSNQI